MRVSRPGCRIDAISNSGTQQNGGSGESLPAAISANTGFIRHDRCMASLWPNGSKRWQTESKPVRPNKDAGVGMVGAGRVRAPLQAFVVS